MYLSPYSKDLTPYAMEHFGTISGRPAITPILQFDQYSWSFLRQHVIISLVFQHIRICVTMTPKEARNRIITRLQQEYYPLRRDPLWCYLGIQALVLIRYLWLAAKMLFLELYFFNLIFWRCHGYARRRNILPQFTKFFSPGFHRLAVLAPSEPSKLRYRIAHIAAGIWYCWAHLFWATLMVWIFFIITSSRHEPLYS